jgi:hypothetical protein
MRTEKFLKKVLLIIPFLGTLTFAHHHHYERHYYHHYEDHYYHHREDYYHPCEDCYEDHLRCDDGYRPCVRDYPYHHREDYYPQRKDFQEYKLRYKEYSKNCPFGCYMDY